MRFKLSFDEYVQGYSGTLLLAMCLIPALSMVPLDQLLFRFWWYWLATFWVIVAGTVIHYIYCKLHAAREALQEAEAELALWRSEKKEAKARNLKLVK